MKLLKISTLPLILILLITTACETTFTNDTDNGPYKLIVKNDTEGIIHISFYNTPPCLDVNPGETCEKNYLAKPSKTTIAYQSIVEKGEFSETQIIDIEPGNESEKNYSISLTADYYSLWVKNENDIQIDSIAFNNDINPAEKDWTLDTPITKDLETQWLGFYRISQNRVSLINDSQLRYSEFTDVAVNASTNSANSKFNILTIASDSMNNYKFVVKNYTEGIIDVSIDGDEPCTDMASGTTCEKAYTDKPAGDISFTFKSKAINGEFLSDTTKTHTIGSEYTKIYDLTLDAGYYSLSAKNSSTVTMDSIGFNKINGDPDTYDESIDIDDLTNDGQTQWIGFFSSSYNKANFINKATKRYSEFDNVFTNAITNDNGTKYKTLTISQNLLSYNLIVNNHTEGFISITIDSDTPCISANADTSCNKEYITKPSTITIKYKSNATVGELITDTTITFTPIENSLDDTYNITTDTATYYSLWIYNNSSQTIDKACFNWDGANYEYVINFIPQITNTGNMNWVGFFNLTYDDIDIYNTVPQIGAYNDIVPTITANGSKAQLLTITD